MNPKENLNYAVGSVCFAAMQTSPFNHQDTRERLQEHINALPTLELDAGYISLMLYPMQRASNGITESLHWALEALSYVPAEQYPTANDELFTLLKTITPSSPEGEKAILQLLTAIKANTPSPKSNTPWNSSFRVTTRLTA